MKLLTAAFTLSTAPPQLPPPVAADVTDEATEEAEVEPDDAIAALEDVAADAAADVGVAAAFELLLLHALRTVTVTIAAAKLGATTLSRKRLRGEMIDIEWGLLSSARDRLRDDAFPSDRAPRHGV